MRKVLFALLGVVAVLVVIAAALPFVISADFVARQLADIVRERTGRELTMAGAPGLSFLPDFAVELNDVTLGSPGAAAGPALEAERMRARVALLPLLSSRLEVEELVFESPRINLVIDRAGRSNWVATPDEPETDEPSGAADDPDDAAHETADAEDIARTAPIEIEAPVAFAPIEIRNGRFTFTDERNGTSLEATDVNLALTLPAYPQPLAARGSFRWHDQRVEIDGSIRRPEDLFAGRSSPVDVSLTSPLGTVGYDGQFSLEQGPALAGIISVTAPSLREFARWAGLSLAVDKGLGRFTVDGAIGFHDRVLTFKDAEIALDNMQARGTVRVEFDGPRPKLIATLGVDILDLNNYMDAEVGTDPASASALVRGWNTEPLDLAGLKSIDANLTLNVGRVVLGPLRTDSGGLRLLIDNGILEAQLNDLSLYGGTAAGNIALDASKETPELRLAISGRDFEGYALLRDLAGLSALEGRGAGTVTLKATGKSQAAMISTLAGRVVLQLTDGGIRGVDVPALIRAVASGIVDGWQAGDEKLTDFTLLEASFDIENGVAANEDLHLEAPDLRIVGEGSIDLPTGTIDLRVEPKVAMSLQPREGETRFEGFTVPVVIKGQWSHPRIYPEIENVLDDPTAAYGRFRGLVEVEGGHDGGGAENTTVDGIGGLINRETGRILGGKPEGGNGRGTRGSGDAAPDVQTPGQDEQ